MPTFQITKSKSSTNREGIQQAIQMENDNNVPLELVTDCLAENQNIMGHIAEEVIISNEHPITLENQNYEKGTKKLRIEKVKANNKNIIDEGKMDIDLSRIGVKRFMVFHKSTSHALALSIEEQISKI